MNQWFIELCGGPFMPHGQCYLWSAPLIGLHVVSDSLIGIAYFSIPVMLVYFLRRARDVAYPAIVLMFAAFIIACGTTHWLEVWSIWHASYWLSGGVKLVTALISVTTAVALVRVVPVALTLPSARELKELNERLEERVQLRTVDLSSAVSQLRREVAQRQEAEAEVRRLNRALESKVAELQALFDALPIGVAIARDPACTDLRTNRAFAALLGHPRDGDPTLAERSGEPAPGVQVLVGDRELTPDEWPMRKAIRENQPIRDFEQTVRRSDGSQSHVNVTALPLRDEHDRATGAIATFQDITARKAAEDELRLVIESAPNAIIKADATGTIMLANSQTTALFGYAREQLLGQSVAMLIPERMRSGLGARIAAFFRTAKAHAMGANRDLFGLRQDGTEVPIEIGLNPIRTPQGTVVLASIIDLTHRKRAEQERIEFERRLFETQKLESIGVLAGGIAHDFNNLLTAVLGNATLVRGKLNADQTALRRQLESVERAAAHAADLCKQLLAYAGQGNFAFHPAALNPIITENMPLLHLSVSKMAELRLELSDNLRLIRADETQLYQVLMNLVINASEAIGENPGVITIRTRLAELSREDIALLIAPYDLLPGWYVVLEVEDNGCGMSSETVTRIFEPFFSTKFIGRGLGLAALIGIVRRHHGGIRVESKVGQGTRFQLLFPALDDSSAPFARPPKSTSGTTRGRGTVLVVDDEAYVRDVAHDALTQAGYEVVVAQDGEDALRAVQTAPVRIVAVLMDLSMPRLDGHGTLLALRLVAPNLPVVLTSGHSERKVNEQFLGRGLAGFLPKPFTAGQLTAAVADAIRRSRQTR